jgi:hypothetical protein
MADDVLESTVRQWLRDHQGQAYCARCIAKDLGEPDPEVVQTVMDTLAPRPIFSAGRCACGSPGLQYGQPKPAS